MGRWKFRNLVHLKHVISSPSQTRNLNPIFRPNQDSIFEQTATSLQHYINSDTPSHGQKIHTHILKTGFKPNTNIFIKLLILHLKCGCLSYARQVFDELPNPTLSAYNYMIGGYLRHKLVKDSIFLAKRLVLDGLRPDGFTLSMVLKASSVGFLEGSLGSVVHCLIVKFDVKGDDVLFTALVDSYVKCGRIDYARKVFDLMSETSVAVQGWETSKPWLPKNRVDEVLTEAEKLNSWLNEKEAEQKKNSGFSTPVFTSEDLYTKLLNLQDKAASVGRIPKPKPKFEKAKKNDTSESREKSNTTNEESPAADKSTADSNSSPDAHPEAHDEL